MSSRREVVCLCGSTRFKPAFERYARKLTFDGAIILMPNVWLHWDGFGESMPDPVKARLDELHKDKIAMSDRVVVVNPNGYVGQSTRAEIAFARTRSLPVEFLATPTAEEPKIGVGDRVEVVGGPLPDATIEGMQLIVKRHAAFGLLILECSLLGADGELALPTKSVRRV